MLWTVFARYGTMLSNDARVLLQRMLVFNPAQRATFQEVSEHPWLSAGTIYTDEQPEVLVQYCLYILYLQE
jgi:serine/threonine protein kinase